MTDDDRGRSGFIDNPGKLFVLGTLGFLAFFAFMAVLEQMGVGSASIGAGFLVFTVGFYVVIGWLARTARVDVYYVAGRAIPAHYNGMATAADFLSGAFFVALAGGIYFGGYPYLGFVTGIAGGFVLVNALLAPFLRKSGCYTVPDFIGTRYGSRTARLCALVVLAVTCFFYLTAQVSATGAIAAVTLGVPFEQGVWLATIAIFACSMLGGMRGVTWTQAAQYVVLAIAFLVPVLWMASGQGFGSIPFFSLGNAIDRVTELEALHGLHPAREAIEGLSVLAQPQGTEGSSWTMLSLAVCIMAGTAAMPHILMHTFTTPTVRSARRSVGWAIVFAAVLLVSAPALATLTKLQLLDPSLATSVVGKAVADVSSLGWVQHWTAAGMVAVADQNGDGIVQLNEFFLRPELIVLAAPEIAGLPHVLTALVAAGCLAATMSTANGLLLAIANALSHDLYHKVVDRKADTSRRLIVARLLLLASGAAAAYAASLQVTGILGTLAWAFGFAASGLFFPLVLGVWWKRANMAGAVAGMVGGFAAGSAYLYLVFNQIIPPLLGIDDMRFGIVGIAASLLCMIAATLLTRPPSREVRDMVDELRMPGGQTILGQD